MNVSEAIEEFIIQDIMIGDSSARLNPDESLIESGIVDSLGILRLVGFIESQFSIEVDDVDVVPANFESINAITSLVERKRN